MESLHWIYLLGFFSIQAVCTRSERDPKKDCERNVTMYRILFLLGFTGLLIIVSVLAGLMVWCCTWVTHWNRDFLEVSLERDGETLLQFAAVYGFRNIQTLVHRMRKGRVPYQLVEVLSCPGGCLNGRGQCEGEGGRADKVPLQQMEEAYSSLPVRLPEMNPEIQRLYLDWLEGQDSPRAMQALHTQYSQRQSQQLPPDIQW